jgi:hypothetical protein
MVESLLLSDRCLERGIFNPQTVKKVVNQHLENQRNHTFLLMAMLIFEVGRQEFSDLSPISILPKNEGALATHRI